jgi:hypothetical protein
MRFHEEKRVTNGYEQWEQFRVVPKFAFLPMRIYQYTSQRVWWFWLEPVFLLQSKTYGSSSKIGQWFDWYRKGYHWRTSRPASDEEYNEYIEYVDKMQV